VSNPLRHWVLSGEQALARALKQQIGAPPNSLAVKLSAPGVRWEPSSSHRETLKKSQQAVKGLCLYLLRTALPCSWMKGDSETLHPEP